MFKCTECEKMYDIKPDYCDDCGNDTFEEIIETPVKHEKPEIKKEPEIIIEQIKPEPKKIIEKPKKEIDYPSITFLGICILISLYIIFFAWNPKEEDITAQEPQNNIVQNTNIPTSVNGFWNNEPPKAEPKQTIQAPQQVEQVQKPSQQVQAPPVTTKTPEVKKAPQTVQKQEPKPVQKTMPKQVQAQPKPAQKPAQQIQKTAQQTQKPVQQTQKPAQQVQKPAQQSQTTQQTTKTKPTQTVWQSTQQPTQVQPSQTQQTVDTAALKKELANYKINLRNTIGRKIDFANVIGDGSCTVSFKIDSNGKLINRAFSQQSTNTTLNDAVYSAVMSTPSYNPPPKGYNNETLHLKISFYNGNFQISLN